MYDPRARRVTEATHHHQISVQTQRKHHRHDYDNCLQRAQEDFQPYEHEDVSYFLLYCG